MTIRERHRLAVKETWRPIHFANRHTRPRMAFVLIRRCTDSRATREGHARPSVTIREMNRPPSFLDGQSMSFALRCVIAVRRERHRLAVKGNLAADSFRESSHMGHGLRATRRCTDSREREKAAGERLRLSVHRRVAQRPCAAICDDSSRIVTDGRAWPLRHSPMHRQPQTLANWPSRVRGCLSASGAKAMRGHL